MSLRNRALTWALRRWIKPTSLRNQTIAETRALNGRVPFGAKLAAGWRIRSEQGTVLNGEWIEPAAPDHAACERCILYFHGGGYVDVAADPPIRYIAPRGLEQCAFVCPRLP